MKVNKEGGAGGNGLEIKTTPTAADATPRGQEGGAVEREIEMKAFRDTPKKAPPTASKYDMPFDGLPQDLMAMMPPDIRAIAEKNPDLIKKAMMKSDEKMETKRQQAAQLGGGGGIEWSRAVEPDKTHDDEEARHGGPVRGCGSRIGDGGEWRRV